VKFSDKNKIGEFHVKRSRFIERQIIKIFKEAGVPVIDLCHQHCFRQSSFYKWKAKHGGMDASSLKRLKELEEENRKLKQMYADEPGNHRAQREYRKKL